MTTRATEFAEIIGPIAQLLLGESNRAMSSAVELRYGAHGSLSVDLVKRTPSTTMKSAGSGVLDLVTREKGLTGQERIDWLQRNGFLHQTHQANGAARPRSSIIATYDYVDQDGALLFQVCRLEPKTSGSASRTATAGSGRSRAMRQVPYRLPQLLDNDGRVVCIVEGEEDVDQCWSLGVPATCNAGGAREVVRRTVENSSRASMSSSIPDHDPRATS